LSALSNSVLHNLVRAPTRYPFFGAPVIQSRCACTIAQFEKGGQN
jgi:hypothetical protein